MVKLFWLHVTLGIQDFKIRPLGDYETEHFVSGTGGQKPTLQWPKLLKIKFQQCDLYWVLQRFWCQPRTPSRPGGFFFSMHLPGPSDCNETFSFFLFLSFLPLSLSPCPFLSVSLPLYLFLIFSSLSLYASLCLSSPFHSFFLREPKATRRSLEELSKLSFCKFYSSECIAFLLQHFCLQLLFLRCLKRGPRKSFQNAPGENVSWSMEGKSGRELL